ncbi:MAG: hypothetical protein HOQ25_15990 [Mesorhizobium sp.]|jgi:hypothetical protein|nr:hypothetical protein [Mesorhizobium sp.]
MKSASRMLCMIRGHVRSRRRSYVDPLDRKQRSYCRRCDAPMLKSWPDGWGMRVANSQCSFVLTRLNN